MVSMHALFSHSRGAANLSVRSQQTLKKALSPVVEPLEQRTLLTAGAPVPPTLFTDFGPGNTEVGGQIVALADGKFLQVGTTASASTEFALARFKADGSNDNDFGENGDGSNQVTAD